MRCNLAYVFMVIVVHGTAASSGPADTVFDEISKERYKCFERIRDASVKLETKFYSNYPDATSEQRNRFRHKIAVQACQKNNQCWQSYISRVSELQAIRDLDGSLNDAARYYIEGMRQSYAKHGNKPC